MPHAFFLTGKSHSVSFKEQELKVLVFLIFSKCPRIISALVVVLISSLSIEIPGTWHVPKLPEPRKTSKMPTLQPWKQRKNLESKTVPGTTLNEAGKFGNRKCVAFPILNSELDWGCYGCVGGGWLDRGRAWFWDILKHFCQDSQHFTTPSVRLKTLDLKPKTPDLLMVRFSMGNLAGSVKELNGSFRGLRQSRSDDPISDCMVPYWGSPHLNRTWVASCSSVAACGGRSFVTKDGMKPDETQNSHLRSFDMDVVTTCWWRMWKLSFESSPREAQNAKQWLMDPRVVDKMIFTAILAAIVL